MRGSELLDIRIHMNMFMLLVMKTVMFKVIFRVMFLLGHVLKEPLENNVLPSNKTNKHEMLFHLKKNRTTNCFSLFKSNRTLIKKIYIS